MSTSLRAYFGYCLHYCLPLALVLSVGCLDNNLTQSFEVQFPNVQGLDYAELGADAREQIRAEVTIEGLLAPTPLEVDAATGAGSARIVLPVGTSGPVNVKVEYFGAEDKDADEVILFRSEFAVDIVDGDVNRYQVTDWISSGSVEFDQNRNGRSNWEDLLSPDCNPAEVSNPVVVAPMTVSFESGVNLGGFTRAFLVVENRSTTESVHFTLDVQMAPGVTVASLDSLLDEGGKAMSSRYDSRQSTFGSTQVDPLAPNGQRVFAVTFAPTSREFLSGALSVQVETQKCGVNYGEIVRVLGNPDGAVPDSPDDYVVPAVEDIQIIGYDGDFGVLDARTLFSLAPAIAQSEEQSSNQLGGEWRIDEQDIDYAYVVAVPAGYDFSLVLDNLQADIDLFLYALSGDAPSSLSVGRDALVDTSTNVGLAPESVSFKAEASPVYLLLGLDRISPATGSSDKADAESVATFSAAMFSVPEFLPSCVAGEASCIAPIDGDIGCPETYATSLACVGASRSLNIELRGKQFQTGALVSFGNVLATCGEVVSGEDYDSIECSVPTVDDVGVEGSTVSISLFNPDGQVATLVDGFTYLPPAPSLISITPSSGPLSGGTPISIRGASFTNLPALAPFVSFVDASGTTHQATDVVFRSSQQLTAIVPECPECLEGLVGVRVTNPDGQTSVNELDFQYTQPDAEAPQINSFNPTSGSRLGGTEVEVSGLGFAVDGIVTVRVGGTAASNVVVLNETTLSFRTPPSVPGEALVQVVNPDGQVGNAEMRFEYERPSPVISSITPNESSLAGGNQVSIWGSDFTPGIAVAFIDAGGTVLSAYSVAVGSSSLITCVVPSSDFEGLATVVVEDVYGAVAEYTGTDYSSGFQFLDLTEEPPRITGLSPTSGSVKGGTAVTISGEHFASGSSVFFDTTTAQSVTFTSESSLVAISPPHAAGQVRVTVRNPDGQENSDAIFDYTPLQPALAAVDPAFGPVSGGTVLTLTGQNFDDGAVIYIDDRPCLNTVIVNERLASCVTPPSTTQSSATVAIYVQNPNQLSSESVVYTYQQPAPDAPRPVIDSLSPDSGEGSGGYSVAIRGSGFETNATVFFGGIRIIPESQSETEIIVTAPAGSPGSVVQVVVQNTDGQLANRNFTYLEAPPIESGAPLLIRLQPQFSDLPGGGFIDVYGSEFDDTASVTIGGRLCRDAILVSTHLIQCEIPSGEREGVTQVEVTKAVGTRTLRSNTLNFHYEIPQVTSPSTVIALVREPTGQECLRGGVVVGHGPDLNGNGVLDVDEILGEEVLCGGADGLTGLISTWPEPPGENCENGGVLVITGFDRSGNSQLEFVEVDSSAYLCNGREGGSGGGLFAALIETEPEPQGEHCIDGGLRIVAGVDEDADGVLGPEEVDSIAYLCNGEDGLLGQDGISTLVESYIEQDGENCSAGGQRLVIGPDSDGDGVLNETEIERTTYLCDGVDGLTSLIRTEIEPSGDNCANGGVKISVGLDLDGNSVLDTEEVDTTTYVCDGGGGNSVSLVRVDDLYLGDERCDYGGVLFHSGLDLNNDGLLSDDEIETTAWACFENSDFNSDSTVAPSRCPAGFVLENQFDPGEQHRCVPCLDGICEAQVGETCRSGRNCASGLRCAVPEGQSGAMGICLAELCGRDDECGVGLLCDFPSGLFVGLPFQMDHWEGDLGYEVERYEGLSGRQGLCTDVVPLSLGAACDGLHSNCGDTARCLDLGSGYRCVAVDSEVCGEGEALLPASLGIECLVSADCKVDAGERHSLHLMACQTPLTLGDECAQAPQTCEEGFTCGRTSGSTVPQCVPSCDSACAANELCVEQVYGGRACIQAIAEGGDCSLEPELCGAGLGCYESTLGAGDFTCVMPFELETSCSVNPDRCLGGADYCVDPSIEGGGEAVCVSDCADGCAVDEKCETFSEAIQVLNVFETSELCQSDEDCPGQAGCFDIMYQEGYSAYVGTCGIPQERCVEAIALEAACAHNPSRCAEGSLCGIGTIDETGDPVCLADCDGGCEEGTGCRAIGEVTGEAFCDVQSDCREAENGYCRLGDRLARLAGFDGICVYEDVACVDLLSEGEPCDTAPSRCEGGAEFCFDPSVAGDVGSICVPPKACNECALDQACLLVSDDVFACVDGLAIGDACDASPERCVGGADYCVDPSADGTGENVCVASCDAGCGDGQICGVLRSDSVRVGSEWDPNPDSSSFGECDGDVDCIYGGSCEVITLASGDTASRCVVYVDIEGCIDGP